MELGAVVLCGGQSRRMGQPKAWLQFGPERLLQRVVRLVGSGIGDGPIVVVAAPGQDCPPLPPSRDDRSRRGLGPRAAPGAGRRTGRTSRHGRAGLCFGHRRPLPPARLDRPAPRVDRRGRPGDPLGPWLPPPPGRALSPAGRSCPPSTPCSAPIGCGRSSSWNRCEPASSPPTSCVRSIRTCKPSAT